MTAVLALPPRMGAQQAAALKEAILSHAGQDLALEASEVGHLGTPCLQVLLCAARDWAAAGRCLQLRHPSEAMQAQLALFGLTVRSLEGGGS